ncbi:hypothetical protein ABZW50_19185 [Streptomyces bacillaris]
MTKPRLTVEEHTQLGAHLAKISRELTPLTVQVANAYPKSGPDSTPVRHLQQALDALNKARSALDDALLREHPQEGKPAMYYPPAEPQR